jgi:cytochrome c oxidase assembly protein subunit 15
MNSAATLDQQQVTQMPQGYPKSVQIWLVIGVFMIFMQVVIGGVTRLTGSGLSITKWEIITGSVPPLNAQQWDEAFELYKQTPQYHKINNGMSMGEFKFIFFWEYFHRLWARSMGFVFIFPFLYFYRKGWIDRSLRRRLGVVVLLAAVVASFGWIMVASGLINRPWVNAYKLTMHLSLALILYSYLFWTLLTTTQVYPQVINSVWLKKWGLALAVVLAIQIILGGVMSGMKAGLAFPTWPDMNGVIIPPALLKSTEWNVDNMVNYEHSTFMPALVQILHRTVAYVLFIMGLWYFFKGIRSTITPLFRVGLYMLVGMLLLQVLLGILTVINSLGAIPVGLGVFHQAGALVLLSIVLFLNYQLKGNAHKS